MNILLSGVVGSTAYGLAGPDSDVDRLGMFAAPTEEFHGLRFPKESVVKTDPDVTLHEARKYATLALGGNPTVMELMWLPEYDVETSLGLDLISIRHSFLSAKRVREAYLGYATQQFRRLQDRQDGTFSSDTRKRTAKHARHLYRLCHQGLKLYRVGELEIRLEEPQKFIDFGEAVAGGYIYYAKQMLAHYEKCFDEDPTPLPERPDEEVVELWLKEVRRANL